MLFHNPNLRYILGHVCIEFVLPGRRISRTVCIICLVLTRGVLLRVFKIGDPPPIKFIFPLARLVSAPGFLFLQDM